ncbi:ABC-2 type transport system permease protein [Curtobacterium sp. PhB42]|uniref:ABC transporter permease subunit n=1 Tax=unclassified Curtobacterium TaxID=257496 RepID=UPI0010E8B925|nr:MULTISPECIES: ABC transporter permease subunit [unclassified Curtobacterium]TCU48374.1 ABC-2 type transport system permease protein [Curtobacterium sp. PhB146]TDW47464.1 ABC-2 type transport system permease protein [Curtobacterium sp. PhB42]TDW57332.1 ABC-2 type transport system permease protein [Curtobacterium sp. PhB190]
MSAVTSDTLPRHDGAGSHTSGVHFSGVLRSEWIKLRSLRSTVWSFLLVLVLPIGIGVLLAAFADNGGQGLTGDAARNALVLYSTSGTMLSSLIVAVIGALVVTGEYGTGMIRSSFAAVPRRSVALAAKAIVLAVAVFVTSAVSVWATAFTTLPIAAGRNVEASLDASVAMPLLGASVYLTLIALLAFAVGVVLRSTAGAIAGVLGLMLVAPVVVQLVQSFTGADWLGTLTNLLPQNAGQPLMQFGTEVTSGWHDGVLALGGWSGFAVLLAWVVVASVTALALVEKRDA